MRRVPPGACGRVLVKTGLDAFAVKQVWKGRHAALVLGWSEDQLVPVVELLDPVLPECLPGRPEKPLTARMKSAIAACARSLVLDYTLTGKPVRYSRNRNDYGGEDRYRRGDSYLTFHFVTGAVDILVQVGLAETEIGEWGWTGGVGRQSVVWPTGELIQLLEPVIDPAEPRADLREAEVIVLRDPDDKRDIDYDDTDETNAMRAQIRVLNHALAGMELFLFGRRFAIPLLRRVFSGDWWRNGRVYAHGASWQNIPAEQRRDLQVRIAGVLYAMVEIDYANLHAVMAYAQAGIDLPPGDQYAIDGFDRALVKRAFNTLLNATSRQKAVAALSEDLAVKDHELWQHSGLPTRSRTACRPYAEMVVAAVEEKHQPIAEQFGSDCGAAFMRRDSEMAVQVMLRVLEETGRVPLPVHDSFLVPDLDQEVLVHVMQEVAAEEALPLCLKESGGSRQWPPLPSPLFLYLEETPLTCTDRNPRNRPKSSDPVAAEVLAGDGPEAAQRTPSLAVPARHVDCATIGSLQGESY